MANSPKLINKYSRQSRLTIGHQFHSQSFQTRDMSKASINSHNWQIKSKNMSCPRSTNVKVRESSKFSQFEARNMSKDAIAQNLTQL